MAYDIARQVQSGRDWSIGAPLMTSTEDVDHKLAALTTDTDNLNADISAWMKDAGKKNPKANQFFTAWARWRDETYKFIKSWKSKPFFKINLAWNFFDNAEERQRELVRWRASWERISGEKATGASAESPAARPPESGWKWLALAAAGGLGALFLARKFEG